jgi:hypothetical protein
MSKGNPAECCPPFDPGPWDGKELRWEKKRFVKDQATSLLHIPLNLNSVVKRNVALVEAAGAAPDRMVILSGENSLWGANVYLEATRDIPGANMVTVSGTFLSKVFEGPYRDMGKWVEEMAQFVRSSGRKLQQMYSVYTTCKKCARMYGKNYVVMLALVE